MVTPDGVPCYTVVYMKWLSVVYDYTKEVMKAHSRVNVCDWLLWFYHHRQTHCITQGFQCQHEF